MVYMAPFWLEDVADQAKPPLLLFRVVQKESPILRDFPWVSEHRLQ
jgi:hypothetical protein